MAFTCDVLEGETSQVRFVALSGPADARPTDIATTALELPELTTSDIPTTVSTKAKEQPKMYGCPPTGDSNAMKWEKPRPDTASWTMSLNGNTQPTEPERAAMERLQNALGQYVWIERRYNSETTWEGGCALVTGTGMPVPADGVVTYSVNLAGYGPLLRGLA